MAIIKKTLRSSAAVLLIYVVFLNAATYYVSTDGNNSNAGTSADAPLKSIQKAVDKAGNGDIVKITEGIYMDKMRSDVISITSAVTIEGGYSKDFKTRSPFTLNTIIDGEKYAPINIELKGENSGEKVIFDGITVDGSLHNEYQGLTLGRTRFSSFVVKKIKKDAQVTIRNCLVFNGASSGIYVESIIDGKLLIENNVLVGNTSTAIIIKQPNSTGSFEIKNNTIASTYKSGSSTGAAIEYASHKASLTVSKNIFVNNPNGALYVSANKHNMVSFIDNGIVSSNKQVFKFQNSGIKNAAIDQLADTELLASKGNSMIKSPFKISSDYTKKTTTVESAKITLEEAMQFIPRKNTNTSLGAVALKN